VTERLGVLRDGGLSVLERGGERAAFFFRKPFYKRRKKGDARRRPAAKRTTGVEGSESTGKIREGRSRKGKEKIGPLSVKARKNCKLYHERVADDRKGGEEAPSQNKETKRRSRKKNFQRGKEKREAQIPQKVHRIREGGRKLRSNHRAKEQPGGGADRRRKTPCLSSACGERKRRVRKSRRRTRRKGNPLGSFWGKGKGEDGALFGESERNGGSPHGEG